MKVCNVLAALGVVLIAFGIILLSPILVALIAEEYRAIPAFVAASLAAVAMGLAFQASAGWQRDFDDLGRSEGMLIVTLAWFVTAAFGAIPYLFFGLNVLDAYFESVSGITTTGATILMDFSFYPKSFFFWRSLSQWLGGMGIIVLFVAILPQFAVAGRQMFFAEAPGPIEEKMTPRITHTAKGLWVIYLLLTVAESGLLILVGIAPFDAVCNSLTTMAAGGFSPHPLSIMGYESPAMVWIITLFMFLAGSNYALQYRFIIQRRPAPLLRSEEFRCYCAIVVMAALLLCLFLLVSGNGPGTALRDSCFQVLSIITTAGFASADFALWTVPAQMILVAMMLTGACAGSAGGGVKVVRILFAGKLLKRELDRTVHPQAVLPIKIDRKSISNDIQRQIIGFFFFYLTLTVLSALVVTMIEGNGSVGLAGTLATIGNIGPGFGEIGPMGSFGKLSPLTKIIFILNMIVGRLELIPFLAMLHPDFWVRRR